MKHEMHEVVEAFPPMEAADYKNLVEDIKANGLREAIWLDEDGGKVIDGRHRYSACKELGIEPRFQVWNGEGGLIEFVMSLNMRRRHLSPSQAAMVGRNILPLLQKYAKARMVGGVAVEADAGTAAAQAAAQSGASARSIERAVVVGEKGVPELNAAVVSGEASVSAAAVVAANYTHEDQAEIAAGGKKAIIAAAKAAKTTSPMEGNEDYSAAMRLPTAKERKATLTAIAGSIKHREFSTSFVTEAEEAPMDHIQRMIVIHSAMCMCSVSDYAAIIAELQVCHDYMVDMAA